MTEMGEYLVGAWLKERRDCDFVQYDAHDPQTRGEVDVIGLDLKKKAAYLCEVTTHIRRLLYGGGYEETMQKLFAKFRRDKEFADKVLKDFPNREYMFWSPVVPEGILTARLKELENDGVKLVINEEYAKRVEELRDSARVKEKATENPAFRLLQILEHLRKPKPELGENKLVQSEFPIQNKSYHAGRSCVQLGDKHDYVPVKKGTYEKCSKCGSTRMTARRKSAGDA